MGVHVTRRAPDAPTLQYAAPAVHRPKFDLYRAAVGCGAVPLITGVSVFSLWYISGWDWLEGVGVLVILAGLAAFAAGCVMLVLYVRARFRAGVEEPKRILARACIAGVLLLSNFPVAFACFEAAWFLETRYTLTVTNAGSVKVDSFIVSGPGISHEFGPLLPGGSASHRFHVTADGELTSSMTIGQTVSTDVVDDYVTHNVGVNTRVTINGSKVAVMKSMDGW